MEEKRHIKFPGRKKEIMYKESIGLALDVTATVGVSWHWSNVFKMVSNTNPAPRQTKTNMREEQRSFQTFEVSKSLSSKNSFSESYWGVHSTTQGNK